VTLDPVVITVIKSTTRAAVYGASALIVGAALFDVVVLRRSSGLNPAERGAIQTTVLRIARAAGWVLFLAFVGRLYVQVIDTYLVFTPTFFMVRQLIFSTRAWGLGMFAQIVTAAGVLGLLILSKRKAGAPAAMMAAGVLAALSVPMTGHAVAHAGAVAVAAQAAHVFGVGGWLGTLTVLWVTCRRMQSTDDLATIIRRFSPLALASAVSIALAGIAAFFLHVGGFSELLSSSYGLVLLLKVAVFLSAAGIGFINWRHVTPRLRETGQRERFARAAALEIALATTAILLTTVLTNLPQPGE
jgi:putative copper export protein